jgi:3-oxoacyl-[acyl-carrier protein] reductase
MDLDLSGRLVAVTAAGAGIGRACALALAGEGARLVLASRSAERLEQACADARAAGAPEAWPVVGDMSSAEGVAALGAAVAGPGPLWGLVAAVGSTPIGSFDQIDDAAWTQAFTMKFLASVRAVRLAASLMTDGGRIVVVAGNAAREAPPGMVTSASMNAALAALVASAGQDLAGRGIGLVGLHPGPTRTARYDALISARAASGAQSGTTQSGRPQSAADAESALLSLVPDGRPAEPGEVADLATYLLSPRSAHLVATTVTIDGGQTAG